MFEQRGTLHEFFVCSVDFGSKLVGELGKGGGTATCNFFSVRAIAAEFWRKMNYE